MKSFFSSALLLALFAACSLAQTVGPVAITSSTTQCVTIGVSQDTSAVGVQVTGTWTGSFQPQGTIQGQAGFNVTITPSTSSTAQSTVTASGGYSSLVAGYSTFQFCPSVASGTASVTLKASNAPVGGGAGGGGTVTSVGATAPITSTGGTTPTIAATTQGTEAKLLTSTTLPGAPGATLCKSVNGGADTTSCSAPLVSGLVQAGLLAEYRFNEGTGSTLTDYSGNGNNGTLCAGGNAPNWAATNPTNNGLRFNGASSQCVNLPAALTSARTIQIVTTFFPIQDGLFQAPVCGNSTGASGIVYQGSQNLQQNSAAMTSGNGEYRIVGYNNSGGLWTPQTYLAPTGTQLVTFEMGSASDVPATFDSIWVNDDIPPYVATQPYPSSSTSGGQSAGKMSLGNYVLGGSVSGQCFTSFSTFWTGTMYEAVFYSTYLTQAQLGQNYAVLTSAMGQRGLQFNYTNTVQNGNIAYTPGVNVNNQYVAVGDSITAGTATSTVFPAFMTFPTAANPWSWSDIGAPSLRASQVVDESYSLEPASWVNPGAGQNVITWWYGTNDCEDGFPSATGQQVYGNIVNAIRQYRSHMLPTQRLIVVPMLSRSVNHNDDPCKDQLNPLLRGTWSTFADGFADIAADPNLGADGAAANTTYFVDGVHPTSQAQANNLAPVFQRAIRRMYGNMSWTSANTYTTAAAAATATTAGSEATNTVTITFGATPANCVAGSTIVIAGTTPAGYSGTWQILTRTATQITYYNGTTALGVITVQGTGVCPQQVDEDVYTILGGSAAGNPAFTMESCVGYTGQNLYFKNTNTTSAWVLTPFTTAQTIDGATSLTMPTASSGNFPVVVLQAQLVSDAAGGCTWKRLQ